MVFQGARSPKELRHEYEDKEARLLENLSQLTVDLRRRVHTGLNKGEARNASARAVSFNRLGEVRDRSSESPCYRASGLNLVTAAIILWNTIYLEKAVHALKSQGHVDEDLLKLA